MQALGFYSRGLRVRKVQYYTICVPPRTSQSPRYDTLGIFTRLDGPRVVRLVLDYCHGPVLRSDVVRIAVRVCVCVCLYALYALCACASGVERVVHTIPERVCMRSGSRRTQVVRQLRRQSAIMICTVCTARPVCICCTWRDNRG